MCIKPRSLGEISVLPVFIDNDVLFVYHKKQKQNQNCDKHLQNP